MTTQEKLYTADDLWELSHHPDYSERRLELTKGRLIDMAPAGGKHGGVALKLGRLIGNFVEDSGLGFATAAETGYILATDPATGATVRAPDVGFIVGERLPDGLPVRYIPLAPDLAVEVVSPTDTAAEVQDKVVEYLSAGVRMVWVVYPSSKTITVHLPGASRTLDENATLEGGNVLPGFSVPVRNVFA